jgi:hypothetical protein
MRIRHTPYAITQSSFRHLLLILLLGVVACLPNRAAAHAGGSPVLTDTPAGPYRLYGWLLPDPPRVGEIHLDLAVTLAPSVNDPANQPVEPVTDATVRVIFTPQGQPGAAIETLATPQQGLNGFYYELDVRLPTADQWRAAVVVDGPAGAGEAAFELQVLAARRVNWNVVLSAAVALLVLMGLMGIWNRLQAEAPSPRPGRTRSIGK